MTVKPFEFAVIVLDGTDRDIVYMAMAIVIY